MVAAWLSWIFGASGETGIAILLPGLPMPLFLLKNYARDMLRPDFFAHILAVGSSEAAFANEHFRNTPPYSSDQRFWAAAQDNLSAIRDTEFRRVR